MLNIVPKVKKENMTSHSFLFIPLKTRWFIDPLFEHVCNNEFIQSVKQKLGNVEGDFKQEIYLLFDENLKEEEYVLKIEDKKILISASNYNGVVWGIQTLLQMLSPNLTTNESLLIGVIEDAPDYGYRGLHLDVSRHFFTVAEVKDFLDNMSFHKLNRFHWHLTDDQGWRIEIKQFPHLITRGSQREASPKIWERLVLDNTPYGPYYYTQTEVKEILQYAKNRGIIVIPEIELPGHAQAALSAYPQFGCLGGPYKPWCHWGVSDNVYCAGNDDTLIFLKKILDEIVALFDGPYIHIGGDECPKTQWKKCPKCQARMNSLGLKTEEELQSWFVTQIGRYLKSHGKVMIGWDEILEGGIPEDAIIMSWQGTRGGITAAKANHNVIMTPNTYLYFDYAQSENKNEPESIFGLIPLEKVYAFDINCGLDDNYAKFILGAQANCWSEYFHDYKRLQYAVYPRAAALAEITWYASNQKDFLEFQYRLTALLKHYDSKKICYRKLD